jgi:hypothetical protein
VPPFFLVFTALLSLIPCPPKNPLPNKWKKIATIPTPLFPICSPPLSVAHTYTWLDPCFYFVRLSSLFILLFLPFASFLLFRSCLCLSQSGVVYGVASRRERRGCSGIGAGASLLCRSCCLLRFLFFFFFFSLALLAPNTLLTHWSK